MASRLMGINGQQAEAMDTRHPPKGSARPAQDATLEEKLGFLARPDAYPEATSRVAAVETHMSWVFLTDSHAYKLKKPVRYAYLDFSTAAARRLDCEEEVRLNRRLAFDVYLGVLPLVRDAVGRLRLGGEGEAVDWLVQMRRLPADRMLDHLLVGGSVTQAEIGRLARLLARFYASAPAEDLTPAAYRDRLAARIEDNRRELASPEFGLGPEVPERLGRLQLGFLRAHAALLDRRVEAGRIVEGHGDLRPEHVCLLDEPVVIDCLEFNRAFRILDPADELGYLALECERLRAPQVARWLLEAYGEASGDAPPTVLTHFYQSCRAALRAKLALWHLRDDGRHPPGTWRAAARDYLELAQQHADSAQD
jgi:aminoglycoside phosphotransferase family enzyme